MCSSRQITGLDLVDGKVEGDGEECWDGWGGGGVLSEEAWPSRILAPMRYTGGLSWSLISFLFFFSFFSLLFV